MPQAAVSPIISAMPTPAVAGSSSHTGKGSSGNANSGGTGGFADALKQQMAPHKGHGTKTEKSAQTDDVDTVEAMDGKIPPEVAALLQGTENPQDGIILQPAVSETPDAAALLVSQPLFAPPELANLMAPRQSISLLDGKDALEQAREQAMQDDLFGDFSQSGGRAPWLAAQGEEQDAAFTADFAVSGKLAPDLLSAPDLMSATALADQPNQAGKELRTDGQDDSAFRAALNAAQQSTAQGSTPRPEGARSVIETPVGAPGWSEEVGNKLVWMAGKDQQKAELVLTPPSLGRIEISITINNDQATANFVAASAAARDALEQSLPKLREMLANSGISLGQTSVNAESSTGQQFGSEGRNGGRQYAGPGGVEAVASAATLPRIIAGNGLVDTFV